MTVQQVDGKVLVAVPTSLLLALLDPFRMPPWDGMPEFTPAAVRAKVEVGEFHLHRILSSEVELPDVHLARIAWLVVNWRTDGSDPPLVEVADLGWVDVVDGYHRICAAAVRGDERVWLNVGGLLVAAEETFGVRIP